MSVIIQPIMPPLMPEEFDRDFDRRNSDTIFAGKAAEHIVATHLLKNKINFAEPVVDQGNDWWIESTENNKVERAQVKKVVYKYKKDLGMFKRNGVNVYRHMFDFRFQSSGQKSPSTGYLQGRRQYGPEDIDVFYHVLVTPLRELIWKIPSSLIPVGSDGYFIQSKSPVLERPFEQRKRPSFDLRGCLISAQYDAKLIQANQEFFFPLKQQTVMEFFS